MPPSSAAGPGRSFPKGFLWGSSTSSHQVEGENRRNDWWEWEERGFTADRSGLACDSFRRYEEDFDLAKSLRQNSHRFSIEWSRLEPEEGSWNTEAIEHYRHVVKALCSRGLEPVVTLHHFANPLWLARRGGWENPEVVARFEAYARRVAEALGEDVRFWLTINEPTVFAYHGYMVKFWPPGKASFPAALRVLGHMAQAHCASYRIIRSVYARNGWRDPQIGFAHAMTYLEPHRLHSAKDRFAVWLRNLLNNRLFLKLVHHSALYLPAAAFGTGGPKRAFDFIGLNYYCREIVSVTRHDLAMTSLMGEICRTDARYLKSERSDLDWEIYPEGIYRLLEDLGEWGIPVLITENGICTNDEGVRARFIRDHLAEVLRAVQDGVRVLGYHYWSLLDNFEWSFGFRPRFGLVHVDFGTQKRTVKPSAAVYAEICRKNSL